MGLILTVALIAVAYGAGWLTAILLSKNNKNTYATIRSKTLSTTDKIADRFK